jgi:hypothetical protein
VIRRAMHALVALMGLAGALVIVVQGDVPPLEWLGVSCLVLLIAHNATQALAPGPYRWPWGRR